MTHPPIRRTTGRLVLLTGLLLTLLLPVPAAADVEVDYSAVVGAPPSEWGSNSLSTIEDQAMWIDRWQETGLGVIRIQIPQLFLEGANDNDDPDTVNWGGFAFDTPIPIPPDFDRSVSFHSTFSAMKEAGVTIQLNPVYLAGWLTANPIPPDFMGFPGAAFSTYPPNDLDEYQEYIYALLYYLVNTLEYPPERIMLDVINEPDLGCGADPVVPCFWDNFDMSDIVAVVQRSADAIEAVDDRIRMVGLAECCGTYYVEQLMNNYQGAQYLSGLTYHRYVSSDFSSAISRANTLKFYGLPVTCNEYGSSSYRSDGVSGALWHAYALPLLWKNQVGPIQFPFAENPYSADPYNSMGLMYDWNLGWARKPAYWVYANFFGNFPGKELVSISADAGLDVLAGRSSSGASVELALWVSNWSGTTHTDLGFTVENYPEADAQVLVFDGLSGTGAVDSFQVSGSPLSFTYTVPSQSVLAFEIASGPDCSDGIDNDDDGRIDFDPETYANPGDETTPPSGSGDPGCRDAARITESPACQDGVDNDGDGKIDYDAGYSANGSADPEGPDPECVGRPWRTNEAASASVCGLGVELALLFPPLMGLALLIRRPPVPLDGPPQD